MPADCPIVSHDHFNYVANIRKFRKTALGWRRRPTEIDIVCVRFLKTPAHRWIRHTLIKMAVRQYG